MVDRKDDDAPAARRASHSSETISDEAWDASVAEWTSNNLRNSALAGNSEAWNYLMGQIPEFRKILEKNL